MTRDAVRRRRVPRTSVVVRLVLIAGLLTLGLLPSQASGAEEPAGATTVELPNAAESWYSVLPLLNGSPLDEVLSGLPPLPTLDLCDLLGGCAAPLDPLADLDLPQIGSLVLPKGTFSVEALIGAPTAQSFVVPDFDKLPAGASVTSAVLHLPINTTAGSQNRAVGIAKIVACLTTSEVTDGKLGPLTGAPRFSCDVQAKAEYDSETKTFTVDLKRFLEEWADGTPNYGVVLRPSSAGSVTETWHVTFNGAKAAGDRKARTVVTYVPEATPPAQEPDEGEEAPPAPPAPPVDVPGVSLPDLGPVVPALPGAPQVDPVAPTVTPPATLGPAPYTLISKAWYTFAGVVYLPLAALLALSLVGRSLTRPLVPGR